MSQRNTVRAASMNGSLSQIQSLSPARRQPKNSQNKQKFISHTHVKKSVSYGQLQIVLQNIKEIREKAAAQIKALKQKNSVLQSQLLEMKTQNSELKGKLSNKGASWQQNFRLFQQQKSRIQKENKEKISQIRDLKDQIRNKQDFIRNLQTKLNIQTANKKQIQQKWQRSFDILAGSHERAQELVRRIKNQYKNFKGIWDILEEHRRFQIDNKQQASREVKMLVELQQSKAQSKLSASSLDKALNQLNNLNGKIKELQSKLINSQTDISHFPAQRQNLQQQIARLNSVQKQIQINFGQKESVWIKQRTLLQETIKSLQQNLVQRQIFKQQRKRKIQYEHLIDQICGQQGIQILQRVRYLQKFRQEHYFNIQKIQYLCKTLDQ